MKISVLKVQAISYRETYAGIDLGTTNSAVAIIDKNSKQPKIVKDKESDKICLPSVVAYKESGEIVVGENAEKILSKDPLNTFYSVKR